MASDRKLAANERRKMRQLLHRIVTTSAPASVSLVRLLVGGVFLSEGIQKFLYPDALGVGRFAEIGIPGASFMGPFVGTVEIVCGALIVVGLLTRVLAIPLIIDMLVAIATTKVPILWKSGFWAMAHEARIDYAMLLGSAFLLLVGGGRLSVDARLSGAKDPDA
jgi:putative oxidoreductase